MSFDSERKHLSMLYSNLKSSYERPVDLRLMRDVKRIHTLTKPPASTDPPYMKKVIEKTATAVEWIVDNELDLRQKDDRLDTLMAMLEVLREIQRLAQVELEHSYKSINIRNKDVK